MHLISVIALPKNLPPEIATRFQDVVLTDTLGEAVEILIPTVIQMTGARDAIFVFSQNSSDPNRCAQVARVASGGREISIEESESILDVWLKGGAHRAALQELTTRMSAISFSEDLWPYPKGSSEPAFAISFPAPYNLLLPFTSDLTVREDDEESFFGYFYLLFERFPNIEEKLLSLIINLPKLISETLAALNRHFDAKIESLSVFAHEFKQFLLLNEQYLQRLGQPDSRDTMLLDKLYAANQKMLLQTDSIILSGREGHGFLKIHSVDVSLNELVTEVISQLEPSFKLAGVTLQRDLGHDLPPLSLDPAIFPSVVHNLLDNARKYSPRGGRVTVSTYLSEEGEVVLETIDQGAGVPEDEQPHIFSKGFRARNSATIAGYGLGLYLAKKIVETHGGSISVASKVGSGSCFTVRLPISPNQPN